MSQYSAIFDNRLSRLINFTIFSWIVLVFISLPWWFICVCYWCHDEGDSLDVATDVNRKTCLWLWKWLIDRWVKVDKFTQSINVRLMLTSLFISRSNHSIFLLKHFFVLICTKKDLNGSIKNLGVIFYKYINMYEHVTSAY